MAIAGGIGGSSLLALYFVPAVYLIIKQGNKKQSEKKQESKKEGIGRSLYCMVKGREIIILHSFIKKSQKTPKQALNLAKKRMKEVTK